MAAGRREACRGELTVAQLEALLFVAERPLTGARSRPWRASSARQVDALLGDLEVALRDRGLRLLSSGRAGPAGHGARGRRG